MEQVKRETSTYVKNVHRAKMIDAMEERKAASKRKRRDDDGDEEASKHVESNSKDIGDNKDGALNVRVEPGRKFKQRIVKDSFCGTGGGNGGKKISARKEVVMSKIFGDS